MRLIPIIIFISVISLFGDGAAGEKAVFETRYIVDMPTAGVIPKSHYSGFITLFQSGGLVGELIVAPFENFNMGLSFGGTNIIGSGEVVFQELPGAYLKYRIVDEKTEMPAICIGVLTQGFGPFIESESRFLTLSPGIFLAVSKNFSYFLGEIALHGGLCYSLEQKPSNRSPNLYAGFEQSLGSYLALNFETNLNLDENSSTMANKGLFNASLRWGVTRNVTFELVFRDLSRHYRGSEGFIRVVRIEYVNTF